MLNGTISKYVYRFYDEIDWHFSCNSVFLYHINIDNIPYDATLTLVSNKHRCKEYLYPPQTIAEWLLYKNIRHDSASFGLKCS